VAWLSCVEVLKNMHLTVNVETDEAYEFVIDLSSEGSTLTPADVAIWLAERLETVDEEMVN
jgi:hypothetical protein